MSLDLVDLWGMSYMRSTKCQKHQDSVANTAQSVGSVSERPKITKRDIHVCRPHVQSGSVRFILHWKNSGTFRGVLNIETLLPSDMAQM